MVKTQIEEFVVRRWSVPQGCLQVDVHPLCGGLESAVALVIVTREPRDSPVPRRFVVKKLLPGCFREAEVYALLWKHLEQPPSPIVLGVDAVAGSQFLYLEDLRPISSWPWSDTVLAAAVCRALARFHDGADLPSERFAWDYEDELVRSAESTLAVAESARDAAGIRWWRRMGDLRQVVEALPIIRSRLLSAGSTVIHGDVHPGNVILRRGRPETQVALIDWSRARIGSPLEDVASWLHALGCWEPEARRRHDTLLRLYLDSRQVQSRLTRELRVDYSFASVSNGLSGAIRYHLAVLGDRGSPESMCQDSARALVAWERVVRRVTPLLTTRQRRCR